MKNLLAAVACALAGVSSTASIPVLPGQVQREPNTSAGEVAPSSFDEFAAVFDVDRLFTDSAFAEDILRRAEAIEPGLESESERASVLSSKALALIALSREKEAVTIAEQLIALGETFGDVGYALLLSSATASDDITGAIDVIDRASRSNRSGVSLNDLLTRNLIEVVHQKAQSRGDDVGVHRLAEALLRLDWDGEGDRTTVDLYRTIALNGRLKARDFSGAKALLSQVESIHAMLGFLVSNRYDPLFEPGFDRIAALKAVLTRENAQTADDIARAPGAFKAILARAQYLRIIGENAAAYELVAPSIVDMSAVEAGGRDAFWTVNEAVYALIDLGRGDEAVTHMERLIALDHEKNHELINMSINHTILLGKLGRYDAALRHGKRVEAEKARFASPFGLMFVRSAAVCAATADGRSEDAAAWMKKLRGTSEKNESATMSALLCVNDLDSAERLVIERLDGDGAMSMLIALQDYQLGDDRFDDAFGKTLRARWDSVIARPAVQAAITKTGRVMAVPLAVIYWGDI